MAITDANIKLMASQKLTDEDDGGGQMTATEVVDGNINNLFPDISRLDRTTGRVSLRKAFVLVDTEDQQTYYGAHMVLTNPAQDPLVNVCLFNTEDPFDERDGARDFLESYLVQGVKFFGWLWGNQMKGSRALTIFMPSTEDPPGVGDVIYIAENEGSASEFHQYVRITSVSSELKTFTIDASSFTRLIVTAEISEPLRETFHGGQISRNDNVVFSAMLYSTMVADAAKYYGVSRLADPVESGNIAISVESIFAQVVPSAQGESPVVDQSPGETGPVASSGAQISVPFTSFPFKDNAQLFFGTGIAHGTLTITAGSNTYTDDGGGILTQGTTEVGEVNYGAGVVTFTNLPTAYTSSGAMVATIGCPVARIRNSIMTQVDLNNRGYNWVKILNPPPVRGTLVVDYMAMGEWYRLRDNGAGVLIPDVDGTGTGTINYVTGSCILTCAALPDIGSGIMYSWGNPLEVKNISGQVPINIAEISHTLADKPVQPGSLYISWESGGVTVTAHDNGSGVISGAAAGTIDYATGEVVFKPSLLPAAGSEFVFDYARYAKVSGSVVAVTASGHAILTLPSVPVRPGSLNFDLAVNLAQVTHVYSFRDSGGGVSADGFKTQLAAVHHQYEGFTSFGGCSGTVDYITGVVDIDLTTITGLETYKIPKTEYAY